jgi:hypothetical protein
MFVAVHESAIGVRLALLPGQERREIGDPVIGDCCQHISEPGLRITS